MMRELYLAALEQRLSSRLRIALAVFVNLVAGFALGAQFPFGIVAPLVTAYIVSAGILGKEFSSGTPQLTFARPVTRAAYVLARWLACVTATLGFGLIAVIIALLIPREAFEPHLPVVPLLVTMLTACGTCAVILGFSALTNGFADIVLVAALGTLAGFLGMLTDRIHAVVPGHGLAQGVDTMFRWVYPTLTTSGGLHTAITLESAAGFAATVGGWLLLAVVAVGRREITYATD